MRVLITGASGFVGSNIAAVCRELYGDEVITGRVDMIDPGAVAAHVEGHAPDAIIHSAILNDWDELFADRQRAWDGYVTATRNYAAAATSAGIPMVLVSTDWVFDGTQAPTTETDPPNPVNQYGFLKAASELVALERGVTVARVSGVNGLHRARPEAPRAQDHGFGYFVASLVDALEAGQPFTVWDGPGLNQSASPSLASMCGEVMREAVDARVGPQILHCCGAETVSRRELAELTVDVFELDGALLRFDPAPAPAPWPIPPNTGLDASTTAATLGYELPSARTLIEAFRAERTTGALQPLVTSTI
ncbi:MAG: sugar nucleotide-binding protein [Actinomycetota bacterium]